MPDPLENLHTDRASSKDGRSLWGLPLFWWIVISFWVLVSFASGLEVVLLQSADSRRALGDTVSRLGPWLFMTVLVIRISSGFTLEYGNWKRSLGVYLAAFAASMGVVAVFAYYGPLPYFLVRQAPHDALAPAANSRDMIYFIMARVTTQLPVFWGLVAVAHAVRFYERENQRKLRETELRTQLVEARLQALQLQINPHFLFNTLNSIAALVSDNPATAEKMVVALGNLLRLTLATRDSKQVTIREELHLLDQYLLIERIRFGGRLQVESRINEAVLDDLVPVFILQPLVENAVKHGVESQLGDVLIQIVAQSVGAGDFLLLEISNSGTEVPLPPPTTRERVGMTNTRSRLQAMFGSQASLKLLPRKGGGFVARIMIPRPPKPSLSTSPEPQPVL